MNRIHSLLRNLFRRRKVNEDLHEELHSYLDLLVEEKIASGIAPEAARRAAKVEFGGVDAVKEAVHSASAGALLRELEQDLRYAGRTLGRQPGFLLVAVVTIALGIGLNASIFSVFNSLLLKPLPRPGAHALVSLYQKTEGGGGHDVFGGMYRLSYPEYLAYRDRNEVLAGLAAYDQERALLDDGAQATEGQIASCNYFQVLDQGMALGRGFTESECTGKSTADVVVLSNALWRETYASDPAVVGRTVRMNRVPMTVIGVAAAGFSGTDLVEAKFWAPLPMMRALGGGGGSKADFTAWNVNWLELIGKRRPGVSIAEVQANIAVIARQLDKQHPGQTSEITAAESSVIGAPDERRAVMGAGVGVLIAVTMVLFIACANLANLMLARALSRGKEIGMRLALGASRGRVVRQLLTESLVISLAGGALGMLIASWSSVLLFRFFLASMPAGVPALQLAVSPDMRVAAYAFVLTLLAGLGFGLAPALHATRPDLNAVLKREGAGFEGSVRHGRRGWLVGGQIAVCIVLLIVSGLMLRALERAQTVEPGFTMRGVAVIAYNLAPVGYSNAQAAAFNAELTERLHALPNIKGVVLASSSPLGSSHNVGGFAPSNGGELESITYLEVTPGFFSLLNIPMMRGRDFTPEEMDRGAQVAIVSESMARSFWPGEEPIGKLLHTGSSNQLQVIGVARDAEVGELGADPRFAYTIPSKAEPMTLQAALIRFDGDASTAVHTLREVVESLDPALKVGVAPLEDNLRPYRAISRLLAISAGALGLTAMVLSMIGLYGTVAYGVSRRTREIGVRVALGASAGDVLWLLIRQAMRPVILGALAGVVLCAATSRILSVILFGVSPHDAAAFAGVPMLLGAIALVATWLPARRALSVDPVVALREN